MVVPAVGAIARTAQGVVASDIHGFPASRTNGPLLIAEGADPKTQQRRSFRCGGIAAASGRSEPQICPHALLGGPETLQAHVCRAVECCGLQPENFFRPRRLVSPPGPQGMVTQAPDPWVESNGRPRAGELVARFRTAD